LLDGGYDRLVDDVNVEIVYIGNVHAFRRSTVEMALMANKHVLVEKPFACSVADGEYLIGLAKERNLFIMEVRFCCSFDWTAVLF
jgi:predicted dehydrogenase